MIAKAVIGLRLFVVVYIHTSVGFGVARFDKQAMPKPQSVERVTDRLPRFFLYISKAYVKTALKGSAWHNCCIMSNIDFELNKEKGKLAVSYSRLGKTNIFYERGVLSGDERSFIVQSKIIDSSSELSLTEKQGLKKYVSRESPRNGYPEIIFPDVI